MCDYKKTLIQIFLITLICLFLGQNSASAKILYLKADIAKNGTNFSNAKNNITRNLISANNNSINIGAGTYFMDNVRLELVYNKHFKSKTKIKDSLSNLNFSISSINTKVLIDFIDLELIQFYTGAGVGYSNISAKKYTNNDLQNTEHLNSRKNFYYLATLGTSIGISGNFRIDLSYTFNNFGNLQFSHHKERLVTHEISTGVRIGL